MEGESVRAAGDPKRAGRQEGRIERCESDCRRKSENKKTSRKTFCEESAL